MHSSISHANKSRTVVVDTPTLNNKALSQVQNFKVLPAMGSGGPPASNGQTFQQELSNNPPKKTVPANGKKTKGRVKIKMEFIDNKLRRYTTFSKRKTGIMKKAYELSTLTGTQVMLLVASETGHVYTFATRKLQPMITSEAGKALIQTCLNSPDPPPGPGSSGLDQRMSATGFEETDLTYSVGEDCDKVLDMQGRGGYSSSPEMSPASGDETPAMSTTINRSPPLLAFATVVDGKQATMCSTGNLQLQHQLTTVNSGNTGFTVFKAAPGSISHTDQIGTFHTDADANISSIHVNNSPPVYRIPTQTSQPFSITISGASKNDSCISSKSSVPMQNSNTILNPQQSLPSGNVVIPASQTILQSASNIGNSSVSNAFMYQTAQGLVYATPTTLPEGVIFNIGQEQGGSATQQYITIPVPLSLNPTQQLLQVSSAPAVPTNCQQVTSGVHVGRKGKSRK